MQFRKDFQNSEYAFHIHNYGPCEELAKLYGCSIFHDTNGWLSNPWNGGENLNANANSGEASLADSAFQVVRGTWSNAEKVSSSKFCERGLMTILTWRNLFSGLRKS